ncbi:MAG: hypothetical protein FWG10_10110 [Eubacteriaceae bacterium]|nr:hypothetical protein [Eubacteriaceae bacterium]
MDFDGLRDAVVSMIAGGNVQISTGLFVNDMSTFRGKDDVLTLLAHLGYLSYDKQTGSVSIPNKEVGFVSIDSVKALNWSAKVAESIGKPHKKVSFL